MRELASLNWLNSLIKPTSKQPQFQKAIPDSTALSQWPLNPDNFTEVDFEPAQRANDVVLQIAEKERRAAETLTSGSKTLIEVSRDKSTAASEAGPLK
jgi:hypothetical protein